MKFRIRVKNTNTDNEWWENYDKDHVKSDNDADMEGKMYVKFYNRTLRPKESKREFISAEVVEDEPNV